MIAVATMSLLFFIGGASPVVQLKQELALKRQVKLYYSHFSSGNYDLMWGMSSKSFQKQNDNDKKAYIEYLRNAGLIQTRVQIKNIKITGNRALVKLILSGRSIHDKEWVDEEQNNVWVLENGRWRFDSQIKEGISP
jgi:hypothetical protein